MAVGFAVVARPSTPRWLALKGFAKRTGLASNTAGAPAYLTMTNKKKKISSSCESESASQEEDFFFFLQEVADFF
jgi:hypothetical protein